VLLSVGVDVRDQNLLQTGRPFILRRLIGMWLPPIATTEIVRRAKGQELKVGHVIGVNPS